MVQRESREPGVLSGSPHPRGDGPPTHSATARKTEFSPPAWGWSEGRVSLTHTKQVLPTRVGMVRSGAKPDLGPISSPHPRGDGPTLQDVVNTAAGFSPPAWGWSVYRGINWFLLSVLPTRVGMVRSRPSTDPTSASSPHPRGDGPNRNGAGGIAKVFSPPAWGWSDRRRPGSGRWHVLPTRVGMVRA